MSNRQEKYKCEGGGVNDSLIGILYQVRLYMLYVCKGKQKKLDFKLKTEEKGVKKFDDIIFEYKSNFECKHHYLQAKHRKKPECLYLKDFLDTENYKLSSYYQAFEDLVENGRIVDKLIIATNNTIPEPESDTDGTVSLARERGRDFKVFLKRINDGDIVLGDIPDRYRFVTDDETLDFFLDNFEEYTALAKDLAKLITLKKKNNNTLIQKYKDHLKKYVFNRDMTGFSEKFINGEDPNLEMFKSKLSSALLESVNSRHSIVPGEVSDTIRSSGNEGLKSIKFEVPEFFKKSTSKNETLSSKVFIPKIRRQDLRDFFNKLEIIVNLSNEKIQNIIDQCQENEISTTSQQTFLDRSLTEINLDHTNAEMEKEILNLIKCNNLMNSDHIENFYKKINLNRILQSVLDSRLEFAHSYIKNSNIQFKDEEYGILDICQDYGIQLAGTVTTPENSMVTLIRIFQVNKDRNFLFIHSKNSEEFIKNTLDVFEMMDYDYLIFEFEKISTTVSTRLQKILETNKKKKVILISTKQDLSDFYNNPRITSECITVVNKYKDLTDNSKNQLLLKNSIDFQGFPVKMMKLFYRKDLAELPASDFLSTCVPVGGKIPTHKSYEERYYIPRILTRQDKISADIFLEEFPHTLLVNEEEFNNMISLDWAPLHLLKINCEDFMSTTNSETSKDIIEDYKNYVEDKDSYFSNVTWVKSSRDVSILKEYLVTDSGNLDKFNEMDLMNMNDRVVLISSKAGMGKSSLFANLALQTKKLFPDKWVIKVDLNDYTDQLKKFKDSENFERNVKKEVEKFLWKLLDCKTDLEKILAQKLMKSKRGIQIFFDGFDEISTFYEEVALKMVKTFNELDIEKMYISTRPEKLDALQEIFPHPHFTVEPFTENDQVEFLQKYCDIKEDSATFEKSTRDILQVLSTSIQETNKDLLNVPIITQMIAELFKTDLMEGCKNYRKSMHERFSIKLDIKDMYTKFTQMRYEMYFEDKRKMKISISEDIVFDMSKKLDESFSIIALKELLDDEDYQKLKLNEDVLQKTRICMIKCGLVQEQEPKVYKFSHRTFGEFYMIRKLKSRFNEDIVQDLILHKILVEPKFEVQRTFLNSWIPEIEENLSDEEKKKIGKKIIEVMNHGQTQKSNNIFKSFRSNNKKMKSGDACHLPNPLINSLKEGTNKILMFILKSLKSLCAEMKSGKQFESVKKIVKEMDEKENYVLLDNYLRYQNDEMKFLSWFKDSFHNIIDLSKLIHDEDSLKNLLISAAASKYSGNLSKFLEWVSKNYDINEAQIFQIITRKKEKLHLLHHLIANSEKFEHATQSLVKTMKYMKTTFELDSSYFYNLFFLDSPNDINLANYMVSKWSSCISSDQILASIIHILLEITDMDFIKTNILEESDDLKKLFLDLIMKLRDDKKCDIFIMKVLEILKDTLNFSSEEFKKLLLIKGSSNENLLQILIFKCSDIAQVEYRVLNILKFFVKELEIDQEMIKEFFILKDLNRIQLLYQQSEFEQDLLKELRNLSKGRPKTSCKNFLLQPIFNHDLLHMHYFITKVANSPIQREIVNAIFKFLKQHFDFNDEDCNDVVSAKMDGDMNVLQISILNKTYKSKLTYTLTTTLTFLKEHFNIDKETVKMLFLEKGLNGMDLIQLIVKESGKENLFAKLLIELFQFLKSEFNFYGEDIKILMAKDYSGKSIVQFITENVKVQYIGGNLILLVNYLKNELKFGFEQFKILFPKDMHEVRQVVSTEHFGEFLQMLQPVRSKSLKKPTKNKDTSAVKNS